MKRCCACKQTLPEENFHKNCWACKSCNNARAKEWHRKNKNRPSYRESRKRSYVKFHYGIELEEYNDLLAKQNNKCAICNTELSSGKPNLDHDHVTGKIRGFLCANCNRGIGYLMDSPKILIKAANYIKRHKE